MSEKQFSTWCEFDKKLSWKWLVDELKRIGLNEPTGHCSNLVTPWGRFEIKLTEKLSKNDLKKLKKIVSIVERQEHSE